MVLQAIKYTMEAVEPKILLIDDREDNLLSLEAILKPHGYGLAKANSGLEALKILFKEVDFALILICEYAQFKWF